MSTSKSFSVNQKGLAPILIVIILAVALVGGYFIYTNYSNYRSNTTSTPMEMRTVAFCDLNADGKCDAADLVLFQQALGKRVGDVGYNLNADVNADGVVTVDDEKILFPETFPAESSTSAQTTSPDSIGANWKTYRNKKLGFELKYPDGYIVDEENENTVIFNYPNSFGTLRIRTADFIDYKSLKSCPEGDLLKQEVIYPCLGATIEKTKLGEINAVGFYMLRRPVHGDERVVQTTDLPKIELEMGISGGGLNAEFNQILSTFKFLP